MTLTPQELKEARDYSRWASAVEDAEARGLVIVMPRSCEAFVDIDNEADLDWFKRAIAKLADEEHGISYTLRQSASGKAGRYHAIVRFKFREFDASERIAVQAALGSDRMRELLGCLRVWQDEDRPTLFFETQPVADEIAAESDGFEAGRDFAAAEFEYDIEHKMRSISRSTPEYAGPWWVWYAAPGDSDVKQGCFDGTIEDVRATLRSMDMTDVRASCIPYPREPRIGKRSDVPSLCYGRHNECVGRTACPMRAACSE